MAAGSLNDTVFHIRTDSCGNFRGNSLFQKNRFHCFYSASIAVLYFFYKMRLIIVTSVDNRTHGIDLLKHGTGISLSECRAGKLCLSHGIHSMDDSRPLIRKIDSGSASKIKKALRFNKLFCSHPFCDLHHSVITGIGDHMHQILCSMSIRINCTFNKCIIICSEYLSAVADKIVIFGYAAFFQSASHNNRLHNRSGFKSICYTEIIPHGIEGSYRFLIIHGLNLFLGIKARKISRVVEIIAVSGIHGKDFSRIGILNHNANVLSSHFFLKAIYIFFYDLLYTYIQCGNNIFPVHRLNDRLFHVRLTVKISVLSAVSAHQSAVVIALNSHVRHISGKSKTNGVAGQTLKRITSQIILLKPYTFDVSALFFFCIRQRAVLLHNGICFKFLFLVHGKLFQKNLILALTCTAV